MTSQMLQKALCKITGTLDSSSIPYALMGAIALKLYGGPQFVMNLELIAEQRDRKELTSALEGAYFYCRNKTVAYSRFESENDICGRIECMFVQTPGGSKMLDRRIYATDLALGAVPVLQPTDYITLKLMAMAHQPGGSIEDEADIRSVLELYKMNRIPTVFGALDKQRIESFAEKLGLRLIVEALFQEIFEPLSPREMFLI